MQNSRKVWMNNLKIHFNNDELFAGDSDWALLIVHYFYGALDNLASMRK